MVQVEEASVTVAVTVTTEGAGGVMYDDEADVLVPVVFELLLLLAWAKAWNLENECGSGSAGALTENHTSLVRRRHWLRFHTYLQRPFLVHNEQVVPVACNTPILAWSNHSRLLEKLAHCCLR